MKKLIISSILLVLAAFSAHAQRTSDGKLFFQAGGQITAYRVPSGGVDLMIGQYYSKSYWMAGIRGSDYFQKYVRPDENTGYFDRVHWEAYGGYMYCLFNSRASRFNLYIGGDLFIGGCTYNVFKSLPDNYSVGLTKDTVFIYGVQPQFCFEAFVSPSVALTATLQSPVTLGSQLKSDIWHLNALLGVRINL